MNELASWERFEAYFVQHTEIGLGIDISRMQFGPRFFEQTHGACERAFEAMRQLEAGAIANPDEGRQVGHYWLRAPELAPNAEICTQIEGAIRQIDAFCADVHAGRIKPEGQERFTDVIHIGIGGSALGPQFASEALGGANDKMRMHFLDNTDPDGIAKVLDALGPQGLRQTLVLVVSKSGGTKETRNGMLEAQRAFRDAGLTFSKHAVAVTGQGSALAKTATEQGWIAQFPMWDWVGGRTSQTCAVGLLPAALQGIDIHAILDGARACDVLTRVADARKNPSMLLALMWLHACSGGINKDMVVLPYKDRLGLLTRYLQQLIMESIGKGSDLVGNVVQQGIAVYGNKGSTDQHAYVQQLREGYHNFFVTFLDVKKDAQKPGLVVEEPGITTGDYLLGFMLGTRRALYENGRESITLTLDEVSPRSFGVLIALYERAVGFFASLVGINAYHQPGVEAGKRAANEVIVLQQRVMRHLAECGEAQQVLQIAREINAMDETETIFKILEHLAANTDRGVVRHEGATALEARYEMRR